MPGKLGLGGRAEGELLFETTLHPPAPSRGPGAGPLARVLGIDFTGSRGAGDGGGGGAEDALEGEVLDVGRLEEEAVDLARVHEHEPAAHDCCLEEFEM